MQIEGVAFAPPRTASEHRLREYVGDPADVARAVAGHDVLIVHGAPVSSEVLDAAPLRLVCVRPRRAGERGCRRGDRPGHPGGQHPGQERGSGRRADHRVRAAADPRWSRGPVPTCSAGARSRSRCSRGASTSAGRPPASPSAWSAWAGSAARWRRGRGRSASPSWPTTRWSPRPRTASPWYRWTRCWTGPTSCRCTPGPPQRTGTCSAERVHPDAPRGVFHQHGPRVAGRRGRSAGGVGGRNAGGRGTGCAGAAEPGARHPLLDAPNVLVTPHIGGATAETLARGARRAVAAVASLVAGRVPADVVNPQVLHAGSAMT